jgi:nitroimidazol reductase NimA-like FMN-containing flavoprotein (pyridoxamine 5'-phosphate oxidase superfamily)
MQIHELDARECTDVLERSRLGRLGCSRFDQPYIVPIHFSFDPERRCLYAVSMVGQKIDWMRANPKVCVEVEDIADEKHWTTVLVFGRYEEIQRTAAAAEQRSRAEQLFQQRQQWWFPAAAQVGSRQHDHLVVYRIDIDRLTGRQAARSG